MKQLENISIFWAHEAWMGKYYPTMTIRFVKTVTPLFETSVAAMCYGAIKEELLS